ncbi:MAG: hypothetical protein IJP77_06255 [Bacteroidales bacterium]|nr:hypothetical protein [Bacteroidales bacterium]
MLSALKPGTPVHILYKNGLRYAAGTIHQVSAQYPNLGFQQPLVPGVNAAVTIAIDINGKTESFERIPLNTSIAEFPEKGILISETREGIINEVTATRNSRQAILQQVPAIEQEIKACDALLLDLNPQLRKEQEQAGKIANLEKQLAGMSDQIAALTGMLSKTLGKKPKED